MKFKKYLVESDVKTNIKKLISGGLGKAQKKIKDSIKSFIDIVKKSGKEKEVITSINKALGTKHKSLNDLKYKTIREDKEYLNEDLKNFWSFMKREVWPSLSFYPILSLWLELDKIIKGADPAWKNIGIYVAIWLFLVSTKHITMWKKWKKDNPDEFGKEGQPGPFTV